MSIDSEAVLFAVFGTNPLRLTSLVFSDSRSFRNCSIEGVAIIDVLIDDDCDSKESSRFMAGPPMSAVAELIDVSGARNDLALGISMHDADRDRADIPLLPSYKMHKVKRIQ